MRRMLAGHRTHAVVLGAVALLTFGGGYAIASGGGTIHACANKKSGSLRLANTCKKGERAVTWSVTGPRGPQGIAGTNGRNGATSVVVRDATGPIPANEYGHAIAQCNPGEVATGGGASIGGVNAQLTDTDPYIATAGAPPTGWFGQGKTGAVADTINVFVICASP